MTALALVLIGCSGGTRQRVQAGIVGPVTAAPAATQRMSATAPRWETVGRSVRGRPIRALVVGAAQARTRRMLVVGCVHGDEGAGEAVTRDLRAAVAPPGVQLWLVDEFNPDGCGAHIRQNAHGVDLNRNSPWHWRRLRGTLYSGPRPLSEPESRAIVGLIRRTQPAVTIWYHQHAALVDDSGGDRRIERRYSRLVGLPFRHFGFFPGSITGWQNATFPPTTAFVVELPPGPLPQASAARHARAVLALAG
jgi:murein peptide amidase A